jgi:glycosyltransferase involved in cell wall biosynthesis
VAGAVVEVEELPVRLLGFLNVTPIKQSWLGMRTLMALLGWAFGVGWSSRKVICCYNLTVPPVAFLWMAAKLGNARLVPITCDINIPGETEPNTAAHRFDFAQHKFWLPRMDGVVAVTDAIIRDFAPGRPHLIMEGGIPRTRMEEATPEVASLSNPGPFVVVMAGSLEEFNGVLVAIAALKLAPDLKIRLVIAGDGPQRELVQAAARVDERIRYVGFVSHEAVLALYREAALLLNLRVTRHIRTPYFFPGKLIEYLSSGTPVLSTDCSHVRRGYSGMLYLSSGEEARDIVSDLRRIKAIPPAELASMAGRAREWMNAHMTWSQQGRRLAEFLASCTQAPRNGA